MRNLPKTLWLAAAALLMCVPQVAAAQEDLGLVIDVKGPGQLTQDGKSVPLKLLSGLKDRTRIELPAGSSASVTLYPTRSLYRLVRPAVAEAGVQGFAVIRGAAPEVARLDDKLIAAAQVRNHVAGAVRMRSLAPPRLRLASPEQGSLVLDTQPTFIWESSEPVAHTVTLEEEGGSFMQSGTVQGRTWSLPGGARLEYGKTYRWRVAYESASAGLTQSETSTFRMATAREVEQITALRPAELDPVEHWVMYAYALQRQLAGEESRAAWKRIVARRPDLAGSIEAAR